MTNSLSSELRRRNAGRGEDISSVDDSPHTVTSQILRNERQRFSSLNERQSNSLNNATNEDTVQDANPHDSSQTSSTHTSLLYTLSASKWALVILAALVNVLTISKLQYIYGKVRTPRSCIHLRNISIQQLPSEQDFDGLCGSCL